MRWLKFIGIGGALLFGAGSVPVVEVPTNYYVRTTPSAEAQFEEVPRTFDISNLQEAHIIGTACYNEFRDTQGKRKPIRERTDCDEHFKRRDIPNYPMPTMEGRLWLGYSTLLFDTPSGDLEEGYYVKSETTERESILGSVLEATIPRAAAAVAHDTTTGGLVASTDTVSFSHTGPASGTLVVGAAIQDSTAIDRKISTCTYNSVTLFQTHAIDAHSNFAISIFEHDAPASGANTVFCQASDQGAASTPADFGVAAVSLTGADLQYPAVATSSASGSNASSAVTITTVYDGSLVVDFSITDETNTSDITATGDLHVERVELGFTGENYNAGTAGPVTPAGATTTSWSWTGTENWVISALEIRPPCLGIRCTDTITTTGTTTWTAPTGVTSVDVACWGAGGGGGTIANNGGAGGGGGAYASTTGIAVTPGVGYEVFIGTGGTAETAGDVSQFYNGTTHSPIACGGSGAVDASTVGAGGTTACSLGSAAEFAGGAGAVGDTTTASDTGGGGGGAGGPNGTGGAGTSGAAGASGTGGTGNNGSGGLGGGGGISSGNTGAPGTGHRKGGGGSGGAGNGTAATAGAYGGGGGGSETAGGTGGNGMCEISYTQLPTVVLNSPADASSDSDTTPTLNFTGTDVNADEVEYNVQVATDNLFSSGGIIDSYTDTANATSELFAWGTGGALEGFGQSFTASQDYTITSVDFYLAKVLSPGDNIVLTIMTGSITGTVISTDTLSAASISTTYGWVNIPLSSPVSLTNGVKYYMSITRSGARDTSNYIKGRYRFGTTPYAGGEKYNLASGSWGGDSTSAVLFRTYGSASIVLDKLSTADTGFTAGHPFPSGDATDFTVQAGDALSETTYYWRVRAIDPGGTNTYGPWSSTRSFTITAGGGGGGVTDIINSIIWFFED